MKPLTPPVARSPLVEMHRRNGATLEMRDGWMIAARYPEEAAKAGNSIVDLAHRPTCEINGPETRERLTQLCCSHVALRTIHVGAGWEAYRLTGERAIVFGQVPSAIPGAIDVTGGWVSLALCGPDAELILNKVTAVDLRQQTLPARGCCQGPIFGVNMLFGRFDNRFELHICGDSAEFFWEVLMDAGAEFGLKPAGLDVFSRLM